MARYSIGVDLGGTNLRAAAISESGEILEKISGKTDLSGGRDAVLDDIAGRILELRERLAAEELAGVGIGVPGFIRMAEGVIVGSNNLPELEGVPVRDEIERRLGSAVILENDANAAALGEKWMGAGRDVEDLVLLTLGTGIGGGIILDGRVYRGAHGFAAEVGHWQFDPLGPRCACGETGHWEAMASGTALGGMARDAVARGEAPSVLARAGGDASAVTGEHVGQAALDGAPDALALLDRFAERVAIGFAGLANILDPEVIVVSGGLVNLGDVLLARIRDRFPAHLEGRAYRPEIPVVAAALGDQAGVIGAAVLARQVAPAP